jgi:hypothetical protein
MRNPQQEQFLDERCHRGGTIADEGTTHAAERDAATADLGSRQLPSIDVGEAEQSDGLHDEFPTFRDSVDAEEWTSGWGFQSTPATAGLTRRDIRMAVICTDGIAV